MDEGNPAVVNPLLKEATVEQLLDELCFRGEAFVGAMYRYVAGKKDPSEIAWRCIGPSMLTIGLVHTLGRASEANADCEEWETADLDGDEAEESEDDDEDAESVG